MVKTTLMLLVLFLITLSACTVVINDGQLEIIVTPEPTTATITMPIGAELTAESLKNGVFQGIYEEAVQLTDGEYEGAPFVEGGASRPTVTFMEVYAFGDLNSDEVADAAVLLVENSGGSGAFRYLAAVVNQDGVPLNVATIFIGDRTKEEILTIETNQIILEMVEVGPNDAFCCPTQKVRKIYLLQDGLLMETSIEVLGSTDD